MAGGLELLDFGGLEIFDNKWSFTLLPAVDDTYDLGSSTLKWKDIYVDGVAYVDTLSLLNVTAPASAADQVKLWSADYTPGDARLYIQGESGSALSLGNGAIYSAGDLTLRAVSGSDVLIGHGTTTILYVDGGTGTVGIGTAALSTATLKTLKSYDSPAADVFGISVSHGARQTSADSAVISTAIYGISYLLASNTKNWTATVGLRGVSTYAVSVETGAAGTITGGAAFYVLNAVPAAMTLTNQYGLYIEDLTSGTNDYGIYIVGADTAAICVASADPIRLGLAGTGTGTMQFVGTTSGVVTLTVAAAAGTWTMTLPTAVGTAGYQLTDAAANGVCSWAAAGSLREYKEGIRPWANPQDALDVILGTQVYQFHYKPGMGTGDTVTEYVGLLADEAPWAMHYNGGVLNPINVCGYMVLGFQAIDKRLRVIEEGDWLKGQVRKALADNGFKSWLKEELCQL